MPGAVKAISRDYATAGIYTYLTTVMLPAAFPQHLALSLLVDFANLSTFQYCWIFESAHLDQVLYSC